MAYLGEYTNVVNFAADADKLDGKDSTYFEPADPAIQTHLDDTANPHGVTAAQAGADPSGTASTLMANHIGAVDPHTQYVKEADLVSLLPSYVDDVLEFVNLAAFPVEGESGKVYVAADTNVTYRWSGSAYVIIGSDLALGETSSTAYRGDRGKTAYDHSQVAHAPSDAEKNVQADWNQTTDTADDYIKNKPTLGTAAAANTTDFAPSAKGVTNGDTHDHSGGDGGQISYNSLANTPTLGAMASQADVSLDGKQYVRKDRAWSEVVIPEGGIVAEAKSSSFTAVKNRRYVVDTSGGVVPATLPATPTVGDYIEFVDAGSTWSTNACVLYRNGLKINGVAEDFTCNSDNVQVCLTYTGASYGWAVKLGASILTAAAHTTGSHSDWPLAVSMTEVGYLDGVTSNVQEQLNNKLTGTSLKTINGVSVVGEGDIPVATSGGAVETTSAVDITLTAASERVQIINMTATGKIVTLPDATTLSEGGIVYIFRATGYSYMVLSSTGKFVATAESGKVAQVSLVDNSTAAGTWTGQMITDVNPGVGIGLASVFESAASYFESCVWLDDTRCFVTYADNGNSGYLTGCVLTKSGTTFTPGTPFVIESAGWSFITCCKIGTDKVLITGHVSSIGRAIALTISGTSVGTIGSRVDLASSSSGDALFPISCRMSDDKVFVIYKAITTIYPTAKVLTVSGTTVTANTAATIDSDAPGGTQSLTCCLLDTDKVLVAYSFSSSSRSRVCTVSGTTVTAQDEATHAGARVDSYTMLTALSSTKAIALFANTASTSLYHCVINISGNTVTYGTPTEFDGTSAQYPNGLVATSTTTAIASWVQVSKVTLAIAWFVVNGDSITVTELTNTLQGGQSYSNAMSRSSAGDIAYAYPAPSTKYGTALLLVG